MMKCFRIAAVLGGVGILAPVTEARNSLSKTPPMGWMSWELFRCDTDCAAHPDHCISEKLYMGQTDALVSGGFVAAGYKGIHMDDCWEQKDPKRDPSSGELVPEPTRFPSGMKALGDYVHAAGASFGLYTAESPSTCGGFPASAGHEALDAKTFAKWGVDYMKVDGCGPASYYKGGYAAMGAALEASGRDIEYSCSWPAYINGGNETLQPFGEFINDGCNGWRNWNDIQCNWNSLGSIIDHWGDYGASLVPWAGPGHWHDMDMLLIGSSCVTEDEERTQMAIWAISASPLIMGNDLRNVSAASKAILLNSDAIAVSQDALGQMGKRLDGQTAASPAQVWARNLAGGDVAVALFNKDVDKNKKFPPFAPTSGCSAGDWVHTVGSYDTGCSGAVTPFSGLTPEQALAKCCANPDCAGFSITKGSAGCSGYFKTDANCGNSTAGAYDGWTRKAAIPTAPSAGPQPADVTVQFNDPEINLFGEVEVYDIWAQKSLGNFTGSYTAKAVPHHGTAFVRLSDTYV